ncbi:hypothetical protein [Photobacterium andalusiense]|uniref:BRCT domain-containing protein n=1 Tax=Photobacterium andalusiense TaxID=2204296 RepID=A0A1Y6MFC2_9GAMM|nr:hypothetical protein [Photobacterium andalusiense]SMY34488.1 hypothetical protein PAND9192_01353 [Photobacterium andalusiense]
MKFFEKYKLVIAGVILGFYVGAVVFSYAESNTKNIVAVLNSLGGFISSVGAIAAIFTLIHIVNERRVEEKNRQVSYANYLMVQIVNQAWITRSYLEKVYDGYVLGDSESCLNLVLSRYSVDHLKNIDIEKCAFLIGSYDPNIFTKITNCKSNVSAIREYVDSRSKYYIDEFIQPCKHLDSHDGFDLEQVESCIDSIVIHSLVTSTDRIFNQLNSTVCDLNKLHTMLYNTMNQKFPYDSFVKPIEAD